MKIGYIERENLYIFWMTWLITLKFAGKMWLSIILKVTKKKDFSLSLENRFLEKPQSMGEVKLSSPPPTAF